MGVYGCAPPIIYIYFNMPRVKKIKEETENISQVIASTEVDNTVTEEADSKPKLKIRAKKVSSKFDIFADEAVLQQEKDLLAKAGVRGAFKSAADINREYLPVPWFALQYVFGKIGITANTFNEFIGQECVGKSSLAFALACNFIKNGIPVLYINTEAKMLEGPWLQRLAGEDKDLGKKLIDRVLIDEYCPTYTEMDNRVRGWIKMMRGERNVPMETPIVFIVDSITNLMSPEQAEGKVSAKDNLSMKEKLKTLDKGVEDISAKPGGAATFMSTWTKQFTSTLTQFNVTGILISGQSTNMNGMGFGNTEGGASLNKTRVGGTAMHKSAAIQCTVTRRGIWKNSAGEQIGDQIRIRNVKNSYGPKVADVVYNLRNKGWKDGPFTVDQAIDMSEALGDILVKNEVFGFTVNRKKYSSTQLGIEQVSSKELEKIINEDEELQVKLGRALGISGYEAFDE